MHAKPTPPTVAESVKTIYSALGRLLRQFSHFEDTMNAKIQQIVDDLAANRTAVRNLTTLAGSIKTTLQGRAAVITQLRADLAAALLALANAGIPPADLQALQDIHDGLGVVTAEIVTDVDGMVSDITTTTEAKPTA
jgi:hypothetical protein